MDKNQTTHKNVAIDLLRGLSIVYIVGFWHLFDSTNQFPLYKNPVTHVLTVIVLSLFVFLSGYLLAGGVGRKPFPSVGKFFKTRFLKIYPPFAAVALVFFVFGLIDRLTLVKTLTLISIFWGPSAPTIWFIGMISVFYVLTPWLIKASDKSLPTFLKSGLLLFILFVLVQHFVESADDRLLLYYPSFLLGIACAKFDPKLLPVWRPLALLVCVLCVFLAWRFPEVEPQYHFEFIPLALAGAFLAFDSTRSLSFDDRWALFAAKVAGPSYMLFLVHRPVYAFMKRVYWPEGTLQIPYLMFVCFPIAFVSAVYAHRVYEALFRRFSNH